MKGLFCLCFMMSCSVFYLLLLTLRKKFKSVLYLSSLFIGELELPFLALLLVIVAPYQAMNFQ